jgi:hypothetical protein
MNRFPNKKLSNSYEAIDLLASLIKTTERLFNWKSFERLVMRSECGKDQGSALKPERLKMA